MVQYLCTTLWYSTVYVIHYESQFTTLAHASGEISSLSKLEHETGGKAYWI